MENQSLFLTTEDFNQDDFVASISQNKEGQLVFSYDQGLSFKVVKDEDLEAVVLVGFDTETGKMLSIYSKEDLNATLKKYGLHDFTFNSDFSNKGFCFEHLMAEGDEPENQYEEETGLKRLFV